MSLTLNAKRVFFQTAQELPSKSLTGRKFIVVESDCPELQKGIETARAVRPGGPRASDRPEL